MRRRKIVLFKTTDIILCTIISNILLDVAIKQHSMTVNWLLQIFGTICLIPFQRRFWWAGLPGNPTASKPTPGVVPS